MEALRLENMTMCQRVGVLNHSFHLCCMFKKQKKKKNILIQCSQTQKGLRKHENYGNRFTEKR